MVFALDGVGSLTAPKQRERNIPQLEELDATAQDLKRGEHLYFKNCGMCHGAAVKSTGVIPDLRMMSAQSRGQFNEIVLGGLRADKGMASFADVLNPEDAARIKAYISYRAIEDRAEAEAVRVEGG